MDLVDVGAIAAVVGAIAAVGAYAQTRASRLDSIPVAFGWKVAWTSTGRLEVQIDVAEGRSVYAVECDVSQGAKKVGALPHIAQIDGVHGPYDLEPRNIDFEENIAYEVVVRYQDARGRRFRTIRRSLPGRTARLTVQRRRWPRRWATISERDSH